MTELVSPSQVNVKYTPGGGSKGEPSRQREARAFAPASAMPARSACGRSCAAILARPAETLPQATKSADRPRNGPAPSPRAARAERRQEPASCMEDGSSARPAVGRRGKAGGKEGRKNGRQRQSDGPCPRPSGCGPHHSVRLPLTPCAGALAAGRSPGNVHFPWTPHQLAPLHFLAVGLK